MNTRTKVKILSTFVDRIFALYYSFFYYSIFIIHSAGFSMNNEQFSCGFALQNIFHKAQDLKPFLLLHFKQIL